MEDRKRRSQRQDGSVENRDEDASEVGECDKFASLFLSLSSYSSFTYAKRFKKKKRLQVRHAV